MASYVHVVLFTFHEGVGRSEIDSMIQDAKGLVSIPTVRRLECGRRDESMQRPVSDTSYHVGLLVCFDDRVGHDVYADHPTHTAFVAKHKSRWANIRVCDFAAG